MIKHCDAQIQVFFSAVPKLISLYPKNLSTAATSMLAVGYIFISAILLTYKRYDNTSG